jgi:hypothetical protein
MSQNSIKFSVPDIRELISVCQWCVIHFGGPDLNLPEQHKIWFIDAAAETDTYIFTTKESKYAVEFALRWS